MIRWSCVYCFSMLFEAAKSETWTIILPLSRPLNTQGTQIKSRHESNKIVINWKTYLCFCFFAQKWRMKKIVTNEHMAIYLFHFNFLLLFVSFFILWSFAHLFVCLLCLVSFVENKSASCLFVSFSLYFVRL